MADYHAILKRAIGALPEPTGEARRAVYEKARAALVNQLKSFDPPLSASEITQQRLQLEDAIRKVEGEAAKGYVSQSLSRAAAGGATGPTGGLASRTAPTGGTARTGAEERTATRPPAPRPTGATAPTGPTRAPAPRPTAPTGLPPAGAGPTRPPRPEAAKPDAARPESPRVEPPRAEPVRAEPPRPEPTRATEPPARRSVAASTEERPAAERPAAEAAAPRPRLEPSAPPPVPPAPEPPEAAVAPEPAPPPAPERRRLTLKDATRAPAAPARPAAPPPLPLVAPAPVETPDAAMTEADMLAAAVSEPPRGARAEAPEPGAAPVPNGDAAAEAERAPRAPRKGRRAAAETLLEPAEKPNRLPLIIGLSAAGLVVAVGVTALWTKRDDVAAYFGTERPLAGLPLRAGAEKALAPKSTDRLPPDDGQAARSAGAAPGSGVKVVTTQPITATPQVQPAPGGPAPAAPAAPAPAAQAPAAAPPAAAPAAVPQATPAPAVPGGTTVAAAPPASTSDAAPAPGQAVPPVAQRALLLEEGLGGSTQNVVNAGRVIWRTVRESPGAGKPAVTMIKAQVEVPDRGLVLNLSIQPNADTSFPASHLIELKFEVPPDFDNKGVSNVPGLILKQTEQARGDPLVGAAARISAGFFWIALSAPEADRVRNLGLLKERGWIDIPILFDNGRRGILTLEKAGAGDRVVGDALDAWSQGG